MMVLYRHPDVLEHAFQANLRGISWRNDEAEFAAWCAGRTGYPVVDAAMRQLVTTGWMHNRARMIVASFLVKDLLVDWRWGERFFMQHLVDGDPAANNGGWQWTSGVAPTPRPISGCLTPPCKGRNLILKACMSVATCLNWPMCPRSTSTSPGRCRRRCSVDPGASSGGTTRCRLWITPWPAARAGCVQGIVALPAPYSPSQKVFTKPQHSAKM